MNTDVDECEADICDEESTCVNLIGGYQCTCNEGFTGDGLTCEGINPLFSGPIIDSVPFQMWMSVL